MLDEAKYDMKNYADQRYPFAKYYYKVVNGQGVSESLCDLVELRESNYNLRGDKILTLPKVNTTKYGLKSLRYEEANLWNKLPNEYRKADSYKLFKKQISDTDLAGRYMS